jgi:hypothetical protein
VETSQQTLIREVARLLELPLPDLQDVGDCRRWIAEYRDTIRHRVREPGRWRALTEAPRLNADRRLAGIYARKRRTRQGRPAQRPRPATKVNQATAEQLALVERLYKGQLTPTSGTDADRLIRKGLAYQARKRARLRNR